MSTDVYSFSVVFAGFRCFGSFLANQKTHLVGNLRRLGADGQPSVQPLSVEVHKTKKDTFEFFQDLRVKSSSIII
jgi:hypothetical protein